MKAYVTMGYQGTNLGEAIEEIKRMVRAGCSGHFDGLLSLTRARCDR